MFRRFVLAVIALLVTAVALSYYYYYLYDNTINDIITPPSGRYAYAYYLTSEIYACCAIISATRLLKHSTDPNIDILILYKTTDKLSLSPHLGTLEALDKRVKLSPIDRHLSTPFLKILFNGLYTNCMTKLEIFSQTQYDRIVYMDADGYPMQNLDHLFSLPKAELAAPIAWWIQDRPGYFSSAFAVVTPSLSTYTRLADKIKGTANGTGKEIGAGGEGMHADMEFLNEETLILPAQYICLNFYWKNRDNDTFPHERYIGTSKSDLYYHHCQYIHFSYYKPWGAPHDIPAKHPEAHPILSVMFKEWKDDTQRLCPS